VRTPTVDAGGSLLSATAKVGGKLRDGKDVAFTVLEPRASLGRQIGDSVDGLQPGKVVLLEDDSTAPKLLDHPIDVVDDPARQRVPRLAGGLGRIKVEISRAAPVVHCTGILEERRKAQLFFVESLGPLDVPYRNSRQELVVSEQAALPVLVSATPAQIDPLHEPARNRMVVADGHEGGGKSADG
jgi:hypothetical protein